MRVGWGISCSAGAVRIPRKPKLGQNFLVDDAARHAIADALGRELAPTVVEIGPGHGAITGILAGRCPRLVAIELDPELANELKTTFRDAPEVEIVQADILDADLKDIIGEARPADAIGNLPYYITSDILLRLFAAGRDRLLRRAVLMMQREVADRVAAEPGGREYGLLSATAQMNARVEKLFTLPPAAFSPPPEVYSTVIRLEFAPRFAELGVEVDRFDRFLKQCFAQKRKTLAKNLRAAGYEPSGIAASWPATLAAQARAEAVGLEELAALYRNLQQSRAGVEEPV